MLISELKNNIISNKINNFYIFTGNEEGIMSIYVHQIAKKLGLTIKWVDSLEEVCKAVNLQSLVKVKYLYLVRQDNAIKTEEKLWEFLKSKVVEHHIILIQPDLDSKIKFYKFFEDVIVQFEKMSPEMLMQYGKRLCPNLSEDNLFKIIKWCGCSYARLVNELDKVNTLSKFKKCSADDSLELLANENGIYKEKSFDIFDYVNEILARNSFGCYSELDYVKSQKCEIALLSLLSTAFKSMILLKEDGGGKGVCERTGLTPWQCRCSIPVVNNFSLEECIDNLLFLQDVDVKIKLGVLSQDIILDYILARIL